MRPDSHNFSNKKPPRFAPRYIEEQDVTVLFQRLQFKFGLPAAAAASAAAATGESAATASAAGTPAAARRGKGGAAEMR